MRKLAEYVMQNRKSAILAAMICTLIPLMGWVGVAIMGLVTLRQGAKEGFIVLMWITLPSIVLGIKFDPLYIVYDVVLGSIVVWLLAIVLRNSSLWANVIQLSALIGLISVVVVHIIKPDIVQWWHTHLDTYFQDANNNLQTGLDETLLSYWAGQMSKIAVGVQVALIMVGNIINLIISRWMQAQLYNPGGLHEELYRIRLGYVAVMAMILFLLAAINDSNIAIDVMPVLMMPFVLAGLSLIHGVVFATKTLWIWLVCFYSLFVLFFPYMLVLLVVTAALDSWCNFRKRLGLAT